jgi:hypothetical protein
LSFLGCKLITWISTFCKNITVSSEISELEMGEKGEEEEEEDYCA